MKLPCRKKCKPTPNLTFFMKRNRDTNSIFTFACKTMMGKITKINSSDLILQKPLKNIQKQRPAVTIPVKVVSVLAAKIF